jgi:5-phospho-D-xylono-1,4-lactonase
VHLHGGPDESPDQPDLHLPDEEAAVRELGELAAAGGRAVMEMGCWDFNRSLDVLARLSRRTGVAIVGVAGFRNGRTGGRQVADHTADELTARILADLAPADPEAPASGAIKGGSGRGAVLSDLDERVLTAAGRAQAASGAPVLTHTEHGALAVDQVRALERAGADPARTAIGHLDRGGTGVQLDVLATGANIVLDQIGKTKYLSTADYHAILTTLLDAGYEDRIMLSSDFGRQSYLHAYGGEPGLDHVLRDFSTELEARGIPASSLRTMLVDNPARFLAYVRRDGRAVPAATEAARGV